MRKLRSVRRSPDISETGMFKRPNDKDPLQIGLAITILFGRDSAAFPCIVCVVAAP